MIGCITCHAVCYWLNDPFCYMPLLILGWSLLLYTLQLCLYFCCSACSSHLQCFRMCRTTQKTCPVLWGMSRSSHLTSWTHMSQPWNSISISSAIVAWLMNWPTERLCYSISSNSLHLMHWLHAMQPYYTSIIAQPIGTVWLLICSTVKKHLLTYLLTYVS